jgi:hypothetical protein
LYGPPTYRIDQHSSMRWCLETLQEAQLSTAAGQLVRRALYATLLYRNLDGTTDTSEFGLCWIPFKTQFVRLPSQVFCMPTVSPIADLALPGSANTNLGLSDRRNLGLNLSTNIHIGFHFLSCAHWPSAVFSCPPSSLGRVPSRRTRDQIASTLVCVVPFKPSSTFGTVLSSQATASPHLLPSEGNLEPVKLPLGSLQLQ